MKKVGIVIIIVGLALTIFTAITYFARERVVDMGSLKISANIPHHLNWSPLLGIAVMVGGASIILLAPRKA